MTYFQPIFENLNVRFLYDAIDREVPERPSHSNLLEYCMMGSGAKRVRGLRFRWDRFVRRSETAVRSRKTAGIFQYIFFGHANFSFFFGKIQILRYSKLKCASDSNLLSSRKKNLHQTDGEGCKSPKKLIFAQKKKWTPLKKRHYGLRYRDIPLPLKSPEKCATGPFCPTIYLYSIYLTQFIRGYLLIMAIAFCCKFYNILSAW